MAKKEFDAVEMTRRIRDRHYEQSRNASPEERIQFYREKARRVHDEIAQRREHAVAEERKPTVR